MSLLLRLMAAGLFVAAAVYALGPLVGPAQSFFREPPFVVNSVVKVTILGLACLYAAGDLRRRMGLVAIVIAAHLISVAAMGSMLAFAETGRTVDLGCLGHPTIATVLWSAIALDGLITALIAAFFFAARRAVRDLGLVTEAVPTAALTGPERLLRALLLVLAAVFALGAVGYEIGPFIDSSKEFVRELPFVTNSVVKVSALAMLFVYAAANPRRNMALVGPAIAVEALAVVVYGLYLVLLHPHYSLPLFGGEVEMHTVLWVGLAVDSLLFGLLLFVAYHAAWRARFQLDYLWPASYRGLLAGGEVLVVDRDPRVSAEDIARRVEAFLEHFRASRRWLYRIALGAIQFAPLIELWPRPRINPPLSELDPASRRSFLENHYQRLPHQSWLRVVKHVKQIVIRISLQLTFAGYYSDERTYEDVGYQPFTKRARYRTLNIDEPGEHPLEVERPENLGVSEIEADVCIVGSGAGGAILAYELAKRGRDVLVLERGQYVEPRDFNESEIDMISKLYADGLMQQTEDWRFTILQGSCVGGSTTVNNAVCFRPPEPVLARWNDPASHDAGLDLGELLASTEAIEEFLRVTPQSDVRLNPSGAKYMQGVAEVGGVNADVVNANINGCYGSGYCNIGCRWGKKLSMLETALPWAQRDFPGKVRIISDCRVERMATLSGQPQRATSLRAQLADGRIVTVRAEDYIVSAGTVGSSYLLIRSGIGRGLPVGQGFSANVGTPMTAEFREEVNAYDGLQISHYGIPEDNGFVFETWFNPPVSQALNMPGWFEQHSENMRRYNRLMAVGVLVGSASNGYVRRALTGGPGVVFRPEPADLQTLAKGLKLLGRILFAADPKPERLMVNTWGWDEFTSVDQLERLDEICADPDYIALGTGHPQGGNALSRDPRRGVVGPDFKVHGYDNLYVCDASVFPTSLTVNPQLTVMSLAHYAAPMIA